MYGSDAINSMEPTEFQNLSEGLRDIWSMHENPVNKDDLGPYKEMKVIFEKSVVTAHRIDAGTVLRQEHLSYKKPGDGISPSRSGELIGRRTVEELPANHKLSWDDLK